MISLKKKILFLKKQSPCLCLAGTITTKRQLHIFIYADTHKISHMDKQLNKVHNIQHI